jgi:hypothetical protein
VLSPSSGPFAKEFADLGVAVWIGELDMLLRRVPDVRVAICNTIMTAHIVNALTEKKIPAMWILHEWWPNEMLVSELTKRNDRNTTPDVVRLALATCPRTVCVCKAQRDLYKPAHGVVTFVGVPEPAADWKISATPLPATTAKVTFLCLGIVCPRKNQCVRAPRLRRALPLAARRRHGCAHSPAARLRAQSSGTRAHSPAARARTEPPTDATLTLCAWRLSLWRLSRCAGTGRSRPSKSGPRGGRTCGCSW